MGTVCRARRRPTRSRRPGPARAASMAASPALPAPAFGLLPRRLQHVLRSVLPPARTIRPVWIVRRVFGQSNMLLSLDPIAPVAARTLRAGSFWEIEAGGGPGDSPGEHSANAGTPPTNRDLLSH